jgi:decaprenylphospho-beta-D-ribofuranose 2-oxidase
LVAPNLAAALKMLSQHDEASYSTAWVDCLAKGEVLGRSLIRLGDHASKTDLEELAPHATRLPPQRSSRLAVPMDFATLHAQSMERSRVQ